jgi:hypothetical protein
MIAKIISNDHDHMPFASKYLAALEDILIGNAICIPLEFCLSVLLLVWHPKSDRDTNLTHRSRRDAFGLVRHEGFWAEVCRDC